MLDLADIPFFSSLTADALVRVRAVTEDRAIPTGTVICQRGDEGRAVYVVASGGLVVETGTAAAGAAGRAFLGPGEIVGEMSILSGLPVSATVIAVQPTRLLRISKDAFLRLLQEEPALQLALSQHLIRRLRQRTDPVGDRRPSIVVLAGSWESEPAQDLIRALERGVRHYAPGSSCAAHHPANAETVIGSWRTSAGAGQYRILIADVATATRLDHLLERGDAVLTLEVPRPGASPTKDAEALTGLADHAVAELDSEALRNATTREEWYFTVPPREVRTALDQSAWNRSTYPTLDRLVRWIVRREIGIALGSGAALGFAHLGVLEVLEEAGVPIDCLVGSSMGGIVALAYAREGNARAATALVARTIGSKAKVRDMSWLPRSALMVGNKVKAAAREAAGDLTFSQLTRPAYVVAADLAKSERVTLDRGSVEQAFLATAAIPALYPPVEIDGRFLVDGALVSRIPVDLLDRRRCGLKIAVNVIPGRSTDPMHEARLRAAAARVMGFRDVLVRAWELLGWWHGASDAALADILIEPACASSGHDFDAFDAVVESGRRAARERIELVREAVDNLLGVDGRKA